MIVTIGNFTIELSGAVTHERYQEAIKLAGLVGELKDVDQLIITESAKGVSLNLRRLREKHKRLEARITAQRALVTRGSIS